MASLRGQITWLQPDDVMAGLGTIGVTIGCNVLDVILHFNGPPSGRAVCTCVRYDRVSGCATILPSPGGCGAAGSPTPMLPAPHDRGQTVDIDQPHLRKDRVDDALFFLVRIGFVAQPAGVLIKGR